MSSWARALTSCFNGASKQETDAPTTANVNEEDLFRFQSGRWLWDEEKQLAKHYRRFDVTALQKIAISSTGARRCISMTKVSEVGGNRVFRLVMDNRKAVIARIPHQRAASGRLRLASEVATMDFASTVLGLPVPKVLSWSADEDCPVKVEYIIMDEARGILLDTIWEPMKPDTKAIVLKQLAAMAGKFKSYSFSHIGSIYFASDNVPGATPAVLTSDVLSSDIKAMVEKRYTIGPTVAQAYWDDERVRIDGLKGPWRDAREWLKAISAREITWLETYAKERSQHPLLPAPRGSKEDHIDLWKKFDAASQFISTIHPNLLRPTLWHDSLAESNIFVDKKNKITCIIDWEGSWTQPLLFAAREPQLMLPSGEMLLNMRPPDQIAHMPDGPEKARAVQALQFIYLRYTYQHALSNASPVLAQLEQIPLFLTLQQLLLQSVNTWINGSVPLRGCLITLNAKWDALCGDNPCPFSFTHEQLARHAAEEAVLNPFSALLLASRSSTRGDGLVDNRKGDYKTIFGAFVAVRRTVEELEEGSLRDELLGALSWTKETS